MNSKLNITPVTGSLGAIVEGLDLKKLFGKSIYTTKKILKGQIINQDNICLKKPVKGIEAKLISLVLGRAVIRDIDQDEPIFEVDLNDNKN